MKNYVVELIELTPEDGDGYIAEVFELGRCTFTGCGDHPHEAFESLEMISQEIYPDLIREGVSLPAPATDGTRPGVYLTITSEGDTVPSATDIFISVVR